MPHELGADERILTYHCSDVVDHEEPLESEPARGHLKYRAWYLPRKKNRELGSFIIF